MRKLDGFWKFLATVFVLGNFYFLFTLIQSYDRLRAGNAALLEALRNSGTAAAAVSAPEAAVPPETERAPIANGGFFDPAAVFGGKLVSVLSSDVPGFNPLTSHEASSQMILSLCTATLAERSWLHPERFEPMLAESWELSPDHRSYRVRLRRGVLWQRFTDPDSGRSVPPQEVTSADFKFTIDAIKNPDVNCAALRVYYQDLTSVECVGKYELIFHWNKEYYGSLESTLALFPLPRHFYCPDGKFDGKRFNDDHKRNRMIVGCGPYCFAGWEKDRCIRLRRNPDYFGARFGIAAPLAERVFEIVKLPNTQFQALLGGRIDLMGLSPEQWTKRTTLPQFTSGQLRRYRYSGRSYSYIGYNESCHCFSDARTRLALTLLIDRQKLLKEVMYGCGSVINGPFAPNGPYADPGLLPHPCDPERSAQLLRDAGWRDADGDGILERNGKKFEFTMLQISGSSTQARMLPMLKEAFAAAGIDMKLQTVEWSVYTERLNQRKFEACCLGWTTAIDPDPYQIFHSSQIADGDNFVGYRNAELDGLIESLRREFDPVKRVALCRKIEKILYDEQPYTFLFAPDALVALDSRYRNVRLFPGGLEPVSFWLPAPLK